MKRYARLAFLLLVGLTLLMLGAWRAYAASRYDSEAALSLRVGAFIGRGYWLTGSVFVEQATPANEATPGGIGSCMLKGTGGVMVTETAPSGLDVGLLFVTCDGRDAVLLTQISRGGRLFEVRDALLLPQAKAGEFRFPFAAEGVRCEAKGRQGAAVVVIGDAAYHAVHKAWLVNAITGKLDELPAKSVVCRTAPV